MIPINGLDIVVGVGAIAVAYFVPLALLQRRIDQGRKAER